jgi:hypothetical protein
MAKPMAMPVLHARPVCPNSRRVRVKRIQRNEHPARHRKYATATRTPPKETQVMKNIMRALLTSALALLLAACPQTREQKDLSETLQQYETIVRWAQWDAAAGFISPEYLAEHPITRLEMDRLRLFRVTAYIVRSSTPVADGKELLQTVEIRMFNNQQARERTTIDNQHWKFDEKSERWLLHSDLPDPTKRY